MINKDPFFIPQNEWQDLKVIPAEGLKVEARPEYSSDESYIKEYTKVMYALNGFKNISADYDKVIDVLKRRAKIKNVSFDIKSAVANDIQLKEAVESLYGGIPDKLTYDDYIDLVKYQQSLATIKSTQIAGLKPTESSQTAQSDGYDIGKIIDMHSNVQGLTQSIMTNKEVAGLTVLIDRMNEFFITTNNAFLLQGGMAVSQQAVANSNAAMITFVGERGGIVKITNKNIDSRFNDPTSQLRHQKEEAERNKLYPDLNKEYGFEVDYQIDTSLGVYKYLEPDKDLYANYRYFDSVKNKNIQRALRDCIPCAERTIGDFKTFFRTRTWDEFMNNVYAQFNHQLNILADIKFKLLMPGFLKEFCLTFRAINNIWEDRICLPDFAVLISLIKLLIAKTQSMLAQKIVLKYNSDVLGGSLGLGWLKTLLGNVMNIVLAYLTRAINVVFGPADCVIMLSNVVLRRETEKLFGGINELFGTKMNSIGTSIKSPDDMAGDLIDSLASANQFIKDKFASIVDDITNATGLNADDTRFILNATYSLDLHTAWLGVMTEMMALMTIASDTMTVAGIDPKTNLYMLTCEKSVTHKPWLQPVPIYQNDKDVIKTDDSDPDDENGGERTKGNVSPVYDPKEPIDMIFIDESVPDDFFEDDPIYGMLDNPYYSDIKYDDTIENGQDPRRVNEDSIRSYIKMVNDYKSDKDFIAKTFNITDSNLNHSFGRPYYGIRVDFRNCIKPSGNISKQEINNWINKITEASK